MTIRKATQKDLPAVAEIYTKIIRTSSAQTGWEEGVYPTRETAADALRNDELFVMENENTIVAAARINQRQEDIYARCHWLYDASDAQVMVLHTLVVDPAASARGYATAFVAFYESYALSNNCLVLRMDTNEKNLPARALYKKLGFHESGILPCSFNGIKNVMLVCLEKNLAQNSDRC